jgi:non-heme chloroperoxidase
MGSPRARLANGLELNYVEEGDAGGEPILFLHGWPDSWFTFSRILPHLPASIRSIAIDQRGFGDSDRPGCCYGISDLAADAVGFLDALSIERASVVGHSLGTFVARSLAIEHPERVRRLVLIASGLSPESPVLREAQEAIAGLEDPLSVEFVHDFQSGASLVLLPDSFMDTVVSESLKAPARVWRDVLEGLLAYEDAQHLAQIRSPALLIWGEADALFEGRERQERLAAAIPGAALKVYPDTGHCPNWERPEQVAADLMDFVQRTG